jgi:hypothetical protein
MHWPDGFGTQLRLDGRARDLLTTSDGEARVLREDVLSAAVTVDRTIEAISADPERPELARMVGASAGGRLRSAIDETVPGERDAGTPLTSCSMTSPGRLSSRLSIGATIDAATGELVEVRAEPRVLPYPECPSAAGNVEWMTGAAVRELRGEVLQRLRGIDCCTHLNDALRSLAEVPVLAQSAPPPTDTISRR